jgi:hypothetical protein
MPMTAAVAPAFAARYPEAAIIFDNLHAMHDVISDILASTEVPKNRKRAEILLAGERYRDDTSFAMTREEWRAMAAAMGAHNMGGVATGIILTELPKPTLPVGATHRDAMQGRGHEGHQVPERQEHEGHNPPDRRDQDGHGAPGRSG